ncbi:hypothetical protein [Christiangramia fulva]|uniref:hypothetical protein n=1 Tax=Christiangramia fulva TaxID=2126553 RepID=UPI001D0381B2|nr:hypothetical protein [Christiangramia fulva]
MDEEIKTWLYDILQSINEIESYYQGRPKIFEEYVATLEQKEQPNVIWKLSEKL